MIEDWIIDNKVRFLNNYRLMCILIYYILIIKFISNYIYELAINYIDVTNKYVYKL